MVVGLLIGASGLSLVGVGIGLAESRQVGPGLFAMALGAFVTLGGWIVLRAALRIRKESPTLSISEHKTRSRATKYAVASALATIFFVALLPVSGAVRVIVCVIAVLSLPLGLLRDFDPAGRRDPPTS